MTSCLLSWTPEPFKNGFYSDRTESASKGAHSYHLELTLIEKGDEMKMVEFQRI